MNMNGFKGLEKLKPSEYIKQNNEKFLRLMHDGSSLENFLIKERKFFIEQLEIYIQMQGNFPEDVSLQKTIMLLRDLENSIYRLKKTNASVLDFMNTISSNKKYFLAQLIMAVLSQQILVGNEKFLAALQKTIQLQVRACLNQNVSLEEFKNTMQIP